MQDKILGFLAVITITITLFCWKNNGNGGGRK